MSTTVYPVRYIIGADAAYDVGSELAIAAGSNVTCTWSTSGKRVTLTIAATGGGGISDGDYGDVVVSGAGTSWLLDSTIAGTAGGRTIYGGNAASEDLHLYSTSHATKGYVYVHDDLVIGDAGAEAGGVSINGTNYEAICGVHDIGGTRAASAPCGWPMAARAAPIGPSSP